MTIRSFLAPVLLPVAAAAVACLAAPPSWAQARIDPIAHEMIVGWTSLGVCLHARDKQVTPEDAATLVYDLARSRFGLSRQQVDAYLDQPNFTQEVEGLIVNVGGCDRIIESARSHLIK